MLAALSSLMKARRGKLPRCCMPLESDVMPSFTKLTASVALVSVSEFGNRAGDDEPPDGFLGGGDFQQTITAC